MKLLIMGATGMVGSEVLKYALSLDKITDVVAILRRPTGITHSKLTEVMHTDFLDYSDCSELLTGIDVCVYCIGVYQNQVSKEVFWQVTVDFQDALVKALLEHSPQVVFSLMGAQGASQSERSPIRFAKAKGRAERHLIESGLQHYYILRPGFINPPKSQQKVHIMDKCIRPFYKLFPSLGIDTEALAKALVEVPLTRYDEPILNNKDIRLFSP